MKKCFKCNQAKAITDFYVHKKMKDGHLNKCKVCTKKDSKENLKKKTSTLDGKMAERHRGRDKYRRLYTGRKVDKMYKKKDMAKYIEKYPEKYRAKNVCQGMVVSGKNLHHWSYNKEHYKDVIITSPSSHYFIHRYLVYDQERMMYRTYDSNILLDSREKHINFIKQCADKFDFKIEINEEPFIKAIP